MENTSCIYQHINEARDKCLFALAYCSEDVPLSDFYFCNDFIQGNFLFFAPILIFGLFICFLLLGSTADDYLTPALEKIADKF